MDSPARREALRRRTAEAARALTGADGDRPPATGDLYVFAATRGWPVEWLVLEVDDEPPRCRLLPVDDRPFVGSRDVAVDDVRRVRLGPPVELAAAVVASGARCGRLDSEALEAVHRHRTELESDTPPVSTFALETDADPEYVLWREQLEEARVALAPTGPRRVGAGGPGPSPPGPEAYEAPSDAFDTAWSLRPLRALAAVLALAVLGLGLWTGRLSRQLEKARGPEIVVAPEIDSDVVFHQITRSGTAVPLDATEGAAMVRLILAGADLEHPGELRVRLVHVLDDEVVWTSGPLPRETELLLKLPADRFPSGTYRLLLLAVDAAGREEVLDGDQLLKIVPEL